MVGDRVFRVAFLVSMTVHSVLLLPWLNLDSLFKNLDNKPEKALEINYLEIKISPRAEASKEITAKVAKKTSLPSQEEIAIEKEGFTPAPAIQKAGPKREEPRIAAVKREALEEKEAPKKATQASNIEKQAYMDYYDAIRERIRSNILRMYRPRFNEGAVCVTFTLQSDGMLARARIIEEKSTQLKRIKEVALKAINRSSPFPPFPQEINERQVDFNVMISFQEE